MAENAAPPWELLAPLSAGAAVSAGWRLAELSAVSRAGSCVLTLQNARGRTHRVHVCRNDGRPAGLVHTQRFDLLVMNGGDGELPTDEGLAQAVAAVAHVVARNEARHAAAPGLEALRPHRELVQLASSAQLR